MVGLGALPGGPFGPSSLATGVSGDGTLVVGTSAAGQAADGDAIQSAFIWDSTQQMRNLQDVLTNDFGLDMTGWHLSQANAISLDGTTIVGHGTNPDGFTEAWMAVIPEPSTALLLASGLLVLARKRRRA